MLRIVTNPISIETSLFTAAVVLKFIPMSDYARHEHHDFTAAVEQALADPPLQAALVRLTDTLMAGNRRGFATLSDSDKLRDHAKEIKEHTLARLDHYLEQLEA